jgi:hypothetical protein
MQATSKLGTTVTWEIDVIRKDGTVEHRGVVSDSSWKWYRRLYERVYRFYQWLFVYKDWKRTKTYLEWKERKMKNG